MGLSIFQNHLQRIDMIILKSAPYLKNVLVSSSLPSIAWTHNQSRIPSLKPLSLWTHLHVYRQNTCLSHSCLLFFCPLNPVAIIWRMELCGFKLSAHWATVWIHQLGYGLYSIKIKTPLKIFLILHLDGCSCLLHLSFE